MKAKNYLAQHRSSNIIIKNEMIGIKPNKVSLANFLRDEKTIYSGRHLLTNVIFR